MMLELSSAWSTTYPEACVGLLAMQGVENPARHEQLDSKKKDLELALRSQYSAADRQTLRAIPAMSAYHAYYRKFGKTYHVQHQLESLVFKNKPFPQVAALVEAMFMAELKNFLLTAGHDLEAIQAPLRLDVADGSESYLRINGVEQMLQGGDMMISDQLGVLSSILYGPDQRTRIKPGTRQVLFTVYGPPGITPNQVDSHLDGIEKNVRLISPGATVELKKTYDAG